MQFKSKLNIFNYLSCRPALNALIIKDFKALFLSPTGYVLILVFDLVLIWLFLQNFFLINQADLSVFFQTLQWGILILASALSTKAFIEERHKQTLERLLSLPLTSFQIVIAKFINGLLVYLLILITLLPFIFVISTLGPLDVGQVISGLLGSTLLFALLYTLGMYLSLYFDNLIIGFLIILFLQFSLYVAGSNFLLDRLPPFISQYLSIFSLPTHYQSFLLGTPTLNDVVFFLSFMWLFIHLSLIRLNKKDQIL